MANSHYRLAWVQVDGKRQGVNISTNGANLFHFNLESKVGEG